MAFKLTKSEVQQHTHFYEELEVRQTRLDDVVKLLEDLEGTDDPEDAAELEAFNKRKKEVADDLKLAIDAYNQHAAEINSFCADIASAWQDDYDNKSETWQEGDKGQAVYSLIEQWNEFHIEDADEDDGSYEDVLQELTDLPTEASE